MRSLPLRGLDWVANPKYDDGDDDNGDDDDNDDDDCVWCVCWE